MLLTVVLENEVEVCLRGALVGSCGVESLFLVMLGRTYYFFCFG